MLLSCFRIVGDRASLKPIAPNWAPRPILQTLVQVDWEPWPTEIAPSWAPRLLGPGLVGDAFVCCIAILLTLLSFFYKSRSLDSVYIMSNIRIIRFFSAPTSNLYSPTGKAVSLVRSATQN